MIKAKQQKRCNIIFSNAFIKPNTVVVKLIYADVTNFAVLGPGWLQKLAGRTFLTRFKQMFVKWKLFAFQSRCLMCNYFWVLN